MGRGADTYKGPERRKSFWSSFFYPLPEKRVRRLLLRSLKRRVAVTAVITVITAIGLTVALDRTVSYFSFRKQQSDTEHIVFVVNSHLVQYFNESITYLAALEQIYYVLKGLRPPDNIELAAELTMAKGILGASLVYVLDEGGTVVGCSPFDGGRSLVGLNYRERPYFIRAMDGYPTNYASLSTATGDRGIYFSWPIRTEAGKKPIGVVVIEVPVTYIDSYLTANDRNYKILLLSPDGIVFSSTVAEWLFQAALPLPEKTRMILESSGQFGTQPLRELPFSIDSDLVRLNGMRYIVHRHPLDIPGWNIVTLNPFPFPFALAFLVTFFIFFGGIIAVMAFLIVSKDELLSEEIERGREKSRRMERTEQVTRRELETILAASLVGIIFVRDGIITNVNEKMCAILGYSEEEMLGTDVRWYFTSKEAFRRFVRMYARQLAMRDLEHIEYLLRRKDGVAVPCSLSGRAIDTDDLTQGVAWVVEDIRERKKAEKDLERAKEDAISASLAKSEFMANMSHEFRTPMNGIIGLTEDLLEQGELEDTLRDRLELILSSARRLMRIINDILEFSRNEVGDLVVEPVVFSLAGLLDDVIRNFEVQARDRKVALEISYDPDLPDTMIGDDIRITQVLFNLVGNGIKFTEQGKVSVRVTLQEKQEPDRIMVLFEIIDTGIGIDPKKQAMVFEAFTQADSSHSRKYGGTGLGLPISRRIVKHLGGDIHLESSPGEGTRFWFILPFSVPAPDSGRSVSSGRETPLHAGTPRCAGHILLAEDDFINTTLAVSLLEQAGFTVRTVNNGRAAVDAWAEEDFDCVLMDIQMPEMDGHEAAKEIRKREKEPGRHVPIVALTACVMEDDRQKCMQAGMDAYIAKPINRVELFGLLRKFVVVPHGSSAGKVEESRLTGA